jgi:signal transduction histidine kinase/DNA-binding response OmpR family regulator
MARILAIDRDQENVATLAALLKKRIPDCRVITAESMDQGIERAESESPDTILVDMGMRTTDGVEILRRLKSNRGTKQIPVLMMIGSQTDRQRRLAGLEAGVDAFLTKPIDEVELAAQVNLALRWKAANEALHESRRSAGNRAQARIVALEEKEQELAIRDRIARILLTAPDEKLFAEVMPVVLGAMQSTSGAFGFVGQDGVVVCPYWTGDAWPGCLVRDHKLVVPRDTWGGIWCQSLLEKRTICSNQPLKPPEVQVPAKRTLVAPVMYHGEVIGVLEVADKPTDYSDKDRALLETISNRLAPVLYAILQENREEGERRQAQEERRRLEARLRQAQKIQAIGTLAGGIAHDFNNILAAIMGYAELVRLRIPEDGRAKDHLKQVLLATYRARDLVKQILTFSRQTEQERRPVYVHLIAKEALKLLRASLPSTIEIRHNIVSDLSAVMADPGEVHQILMNLCTNAHEAMREKGGILNVDLANVDLGVCEVARYPGLKPGLYLKLSVTDTGCGMNRRTVERIFDPYFTTKEKGQGTGLGLAVVHGIVANLGGIIDVESEPGEGTAFHVWLPRVETGQKGNMESSEPPPKGDGRILLVDDEKILVDSGQEMLTHLGYEVVTKTSSVEALELFREQAGQFDLVITDMTMPDMTGDKLARKLMGIRRDIPIILCTGFSERITKEEAEKVGIREFLMKPIASRELAEVIRRVLSGVHP